MAEATREAWRFRVSGRVQGVGYRAFVLRSAEELQLAGWVRNDPGGTVTALAVGPAAALERFAEELARGPRAARVAAVERSSEPAAESLSGFTVRP